MNSVVSGFVRSLLKNMMRKQGGVAIALEDCAALQVVDNTYRIISANGIARAYKIYWQDNMFYEIEIEKHTQFQPLHELIEKKAILL